MATLSGRAHKYRAAPREHDAPATYQDFAALMDSYEQEHFASDPGARAVADATLALLTTFPPNHRAPAAVVRRFSLALMDDPLLDAFGYPRPSALERRLAAGWPRLRARLVRRLPVRVEPRFARDLPNIRSYPNGYDVAELSAKRVPTRRQRRGQLSLSPPRGARPPRPGGNGTAGC